MIFKQPNGSCAVCARFSCDGERCNPPPPRGPSLWRRLLCRLGRHYRLDVIQSFGAAKHIGCPDCGAQMGMHDGLRTVIPWDGELAQLYTDAGHPVAQATAQWLRRRRGVVNI